MLVKEILKTIHKNTPLLFGLLLATSVLFILTETLIPQSISAYFSINNLLFTTAIVGIIAALTPQAKHGNK